MVQNVSEDRSAMSFPELLACAWRETPRVHKNDLNLLIHIIAVPLFVFGHVLLVAGIFINPWLLVGAFVIIVVSLVAQTIGHSLEQTQLATFAGPGDLLRRVYAEQFCNFWRFLFSGQWYASFKARRSGA
jgi:hypothetical protein